MISVHAQQLEPGATGRTHAVTQVDEPDSPFRYLDNASGLAGITDMTQRVAGQKVGIIGLGGSGSFVLDLIAKSWVAEIHLYDGDDLIQHNAFRCPGAVSAETLRVRPVKADHYAAIYDVFRRGVVPHPYYITEAHLPELDELDFVFICIDKGSAKEKIIDHLEATGKSFIDVGMGVEVVDGKLLGVVRTSASTPDDRDTLRKFVRFGDGEEDAAYTKNVQIAELNALNACLAVIKWKKLSGIYLDLEGEMNANYTIDGNHMSNE
jgi:tRNA A37 threonylcarbamoyladenosine dehydratase